MRAEIGYVDRENLLLGGVRMGFGNRSGWFEPDITELSGVGGRAVASAFCSRPEGGVCALAFRAGDRGASFVRLKCRRGRKKAASRGQPPVHTLPDYSAIPTKVPALFRALVISSGVIRFVSYLTVFVSRKPRNPRVTSTTPSSPSRAALPTSYQAT